MYYTKLAQCEDTVSKRMIHINLFWKNPILVKII